MNKTPIALTIGGLPFRLMPQQVGAEQLEAICDLDPDSLQER